MTTHVAPVKFAGKLPAAQYHSSFFRSLKSELLKLRYTSGIVIAAATEIVMVFGIMWVVANPDHFAASETVGVGAITSGFTLTILFAAIIGAMAVTNEYSHNTMRTTALADSNRTRSFAAKAVAVGLFMVLVNLVVLLLASIPLKVRLGSTYSLGTEDVQTTLHFLAVNVAVALIAIGFGYALRSTAGTISIMVFLLFVIDAVRIIPMEFFRETAPKYFITNLAMVMIDGVSDVEGMSFTPLVDSRALAYGGMGLWVLFGLGLGYIVFRKRDI